MSTHKAAVITKDAAPGKFSTIADVPIPTPGPNQILVKTVAIAANPTDWKHILNGSQPGFIVGSDGSGIVTRIGSDVKDFKEGDFVSTFVHGSFSDKIGTFAEYFVANPNATIKYDPSILKEDKVLKDGQTYPSGIIDSFEGAASVTLGLVTVVLSFSGNLNISKADKGKSILIWGGAGATGILAIQIAKQAFGLNVITVASPKNFEFLKSLGADHVFNYKDADVVDQIKAAANGDIRYALDTVASDDSFKATYAATYDSPEVTIDSLLFKGKEDVTDDGREGKVDFAYTTLAYVVDGNVPLNFFGKVLDITPESNASYESFWFNELPKLIPALRTANLKVLPKGLKNVDAALDLLLQNQVSAEKVVLRV
jgi:NADPH:quinone reductase-like Zn-dependent oxidoreductase